MANPLAQTMQYVTKDNISGLNISIFNMFNPPSCKILLPTKKCYVLLPQGSPVIEKYQILYQFIGFSTKVTSMHTSMPKTVTDFKCRF